MRIKTCIKPDPYIQAATCFVERKELAFTILGHMASIYELAMTVHIPNSHLLPAAELLPLTAPVHTKFQSSVFFREFHEAFYPLSEFEIEYDPKSDERCRICSSVNVMCMMASSPSCRKTTKFITDTAGGRATDIIARRNYDWVAALTKFQRKSEIGTDFRSGPQRIKRAIEIFALLYQIRTGTPKLSLAEAGAEYGVKKVQPHCPMCQSDHPEMCPIHQVHFLSQKAQGKQHSGCILRLLPPDVSEDQQSQTNNPPTE